MGSHNRGKGKGAIWLLDHLSHIGDECLTYPFHRDEDGYGILGYLGKSWRAHRLMCTLVKGDPPTPEHHAAHSCHNGHLGCVHPQHLDWKTPGENTREYVEHNGGTVNTARRLTIEQVEAIRASDRTIRDLAAEYGVHKNTIGMIRRGDRWKTPRSTVTREQILKIRELYATGIGATAISRKTGIKYSVAYRLKYRDTYRSL